MKWIHHSLRTALTSRCHEFILDGVIPNLMASSRTLAFYPASGGIWHGSASEPHGSKEWPRRE
jgi:hypothetical protein